MMNVTPIATSRDGAASTPMRAKFLTDRKLGLSSPKPMHTASSTNKGAHLRTLVSFNAKTLATLASS